MRNTRKPPATGVNVTELRQNLPAYLAEVKKGYEIEVTSRGRVIARIVAGGDHHEAARERLLAARKHCRVGDVASPTGAKWDAER
jgi:prevent-host-death family protein